MVASGKSDWMPIAVRRFGPLPAEVSSKIPPPQNMISFSWEFLQATFGGSQWSPGLYFKPNSEGPRILRKGTYLALDATYEPYHPGTPGQHGAKLTAFFRENVEDSENDPGEDGCMNVPLFVCCSSGSKDKDRFMYFGTYSQTRWSDKLDFDRMVEQVPHAVKMYWAEQLTDKERPGWVTEALMKHFWYVTVSRP